MSHFIGRQDELKRLVEITKKTRPLLMQVTCFWQRRNRFIGDWLYAAPYFWNRVAFFIQYQIGKGPDQGIQAVG